MRFIADGVNIPDELLWAQDEGRVVFFCGAGVSRARAGLPDFNRLTQEVLEGLGATDEDDATRLHELAKVAREAHGVGLTISDRVFQLLRRRFTDVDISKKVAECLKPEERVDLDAHRILLKLARRKTGETRIITTNFDRLFEQSNAKLKTVTRSTLPNVAFNEADWGVVHLHGCVEPDYSGPTRDGFVLSSAEFGDAYLAKGWAREFVREILDRFVAVFVGYSADDPPIRYLLEGLRLSGPQINRAYAFQSDEDNGAPISWEEKGVEALIYSTEAGCGHRRLWDTLEEWAKRTTSPVKWRARALKRSYKGPVRLLPHERGMIAHIVSSVAGAEAFAQHMPSMSAEWLCVFDPVVRFGEPRSQDGFYGGAIVDPFDRYQIDSDLPPRKTSKQYGQQKRIPEGAWSAFFLGSRDLKEPDANQFSSIRGPNARTVPNLPRRIQLLAHWIWSVSDQPAAAWWAGQQSSLHHEVLDRVLLYRPVAKQDMIPVVARAWQAIKECNELSINEESGHALRLSRAGRDGLFAQKFANHFLPGLRVGGLFRRSFPPSMKARLRVQDLVNVEVYYQSDIRDVEVPDSYLQEVLPKLRVALELAEELEGRYSYSIDICSIEPDSEDEHGNDGRSSYSREHGLSGHVLLFVDLFRRLAARDTQAARLELSLWPRNRIVFNRLRIWALGNLDLVAASDYGAELIALPDDSFWPFRGERDLLLGMARRWGELPEDLRKAIERRLLKGPRRNRRLKKGEFVERSAHRRLSRINWLFSQDCNFTFDLATENARLQKLAPSWRSEFSARAAESHDGRSGRVRTDIDFSAIEHLTSKEIIPFVETMERRSDLGFVAREPFLGLSQEKPRQALAALAASADRDSFAARHWETFLGVDARRGDQLELSIEIAREVLKIPDQHFGSIAHTASSWFKQVGPVLLRESEDIFEELWSKFLRAMGMHDSAGQSSLVRQSQAPDWATESINSAPGNLAELALSLPVDPPPKPAQGFPQRWRARIEQLLSLPGDSRRYALVIVGHQLNRFYYVDPEWARQHILNVLESGNIELDQDAIWAGFFWQARMPGQELFELLKPHLLRLCRQQTEQQTRNIEILAGLVLAGWGTRHSSTHERLISSSEMRAAILSASNELRQSVVWQLDRWSDDSEGEGIWAPQVEEFLREAWPRQKDIRSAKISASLCELALSQKTNFPKIAGLVSQLVSKVDHDRIFIPELRNAKETIALEFPDALLGLLYAILPENAIQWPYGAVDALRTLGQEHPSIRADVRYIELDSRLH